MFTIHNLAYQGVFPKDMMAISELPLELFSMRGLEFYGKMNFMKGGIVFADVITTVSAKYSQEIQTPEYGNGLDGVLREKPAVTSIRGENFGALMVRCIFHTWCHLGEISSIRQILGHKPPQFVDMHGWAYGGE